MEKLINPVVTAGILKKYNFHFQKKYGQNFLIDSHVLDKIIGSAGITKDDLVLEIGPGIGTMTQFLCEAAGKVLAVEIDDRLIPVLAETLAEYDNVTVINNDILKMDFNEIANKYNDGKPVKVVANLPYYITTPIVMGLFESGAPLESITIMIQKEVADRMRAEPGGKDYGALSLAVQYYSQPEIVAVVPPNCFMPRPGVSSEVIKLTYLHEKPIKVNDEKYMFDVIRAAFNQRRKTLVNALGNAAKLSVSKDTVKEALSKMGLDERIRGEALSLEQFAIISDLLKK